MIGLVPAGDKRRYALAAADAAVVAGAAVGAFGIRYFSTEALDYVGEYWWLVPLSVAICLGSFRIFGLYGWVWYYMGLKEAVALSKAITVSSVAIAAIAMAATRLSFPETVLIVEWLLLMVFVGGERLLFRIWRESTAKKAEAGVRGKRLLIVGAGDASETIIREIDKNPKLGYQPVACADDDRRKLGRNLHQVPVLGTTEDIPDLVSQHHIEEIVIAIPSASGAEMRGIVEQCERSRVSFRTLPALHELIAGNMTFGQIREVQIEDLLGREPHTEDLTGVASYLTGARVLVTGAGGSIGSELCRQIAIYEPAELILFDWGENSMYQAEMELCQKFPTLNMEIVVGDIQNQARVDEVMKAHRPTVIFHAAAHKHVPLMELNPGEAVLNNITGTRVLVQAADRYGVDRFVFISSDKAVNPTSVMGTTKRIGEAMIQCKASVSQTRFAAVRFGNVLGSQGSVVPLFKRQIAQGGPITVTHPEAMRYFMTISEAVQLIIQAAGLGRGGEIFILDMDRPVKILDLAKDMIRLSGLDEGDIEIKLIGWRPGEKLCEELLTAEEEINATVHRKIFVARPNSIDATQLWQELEELEELALGSDAEAIKRKLKQIVPGYQPAPSSVASQEVRL